MAMERVEEGFSEAEFNEKYLTFIENLRTAIKTQLMNAIEFALEQFEKNKEIKVKISFSNFLLLLKK